MRIVGFIVHEVLFVLLSATGSALWGGQRQDGQVFVCARALRRRPGQFSVQHMDWRL